MVMGAGGVLGPLVQVLVGNSKARETLGYLYLMCHLLVKYSSGGSIPSLRLMYTWPDSAILYHVLSTDAGV